MGEDVKIHDEVERRAQKPHRCCECRTVINPGNRYISVSILDEDGWGHYKQCVECNMVMVTAADVMRQDGPLFPEDYPGFMNLDQYIENMFDEWTKEELHEHAGALLTTPQHLQRLLNINEDELESRPIKYCLK